MKKIVKLVMFLCLSVVLISGCGKKEDEATQKETHASTTVVEDKKIQVIVSIDNGDKKEDKEIEIDKNETLLEVMEKNFDAKNDKGFVTAIDGVEQNKEENKYWLFIINGEEVNKGAQEVKLKNGDRIEWELKKF